ncbi:MAG TPA: 5-formyltetrahydrofolate cyclo-ligase [Planctomycetota bacterium]
MSNAKKELRVMVRARLNAMSSVEREEAAREALTRLLASPQFAGARKVLAYDAFGTEVSTHGFMRACLDAGKTLALPRTEPSTRSIRALTITDLDRDLEISAFGFCEPKASLPEIPANQLDLVLVPGLAFDLKGNRLGRGAGYYDRFLAQPALSAATVALAFECQIVDEVPALRHDKAVQFIFTERRLIEAGSR